MTESKNQQGLKKFFKVITLVGKSFIAGLKKTMSLDWADYIFIISPYSFAFLYFWGRYMFINWQLAYITLAIYLSVFVVCMGLNKVFELRRYQLALNIVGLNSSSAPKPILIKIIEEGQNKTLLIKSPGVGVQNYENKKGDLESAFAQMIDLISTKENPEFVLINLCKKKLTAKVSFLENEYRLKEPYCFMVGDSRSGFITTSIVKLPHMLIAGTTGGGKSVFFKQTLLGLLKSSNNLQFYLLDLKNGLELGDFEVLPNVKVAKNVANGLTLLKIVKSEMDRRFKFLQEMGKKEIDPERDKLDRIVVGIDEASIIYTLSRGNKLANITTNSCRELTDEIAKLGRAAGIHLILATQKVSKETIDTKVQENIGGRVCFRTNSIMGSVAMLGNKMAFEIPATPGRAVWGYGHDFIEIQAPILNDEELEEEISLLIENFKTKRKTFFGPMLKLTELTISSDQNFNEQKGNNN